MSTTSEKRRTGSCLCGRAKFAVVGDVKAVGQCLCSQCRKVSGTNGNAVFLISIAQFEWVGEEPKTVKFSLPSGWSVLRCRECGSPLPQSHDGDRMWVTAGLMDDDLGAEVAYKIFVGSRADWDHEAKNIAEFEEMPPV
jgi:hypothetical protein